LCAIASAIVASPAGAPQGARAPGGDPEWPVLAHHTGAQVVQPARGSALPVACATETGYATSESTLAVTKTGALFYSPAETENAMARATGDLRTEPGVTENSPLPNAIQTIVASAHRFPVYASDKGRDWTTADYSHENMGDWAQPAPLPAKVEASR